MPTYRKLHTKTLESYDFAEMPDDFTRVFWILLILIVDREGLAIDDAPYLRSKMFPLRSDVELQAVEEALAWLDLRGMILRYQVNGRKYFQIIKFKSHQSGLDREAPSHLPLPNISRSTHDQLESNSRADQAAVEQAESATATVFESVPEPERPNIYAVYEREIGPLTPLIGDELEAAEKDYPAGWVEAALKEASVYNHRSWKYAATILKNWKANGRGEKAPHNKKPATRVYTDAWGQKIEEPA